MLCISEQYNSKPTSCQGRYIYSRMWMRSATLRYLLPPFDATVYAVLSRKHVRWLYSALELASPLTSRSCTHYLALHLLQWYLMTLRRAF